MQNETETIDGEIDERVGEPMPSHPTTRELIERLPAVSDTSAKISAVAGGVSFSSIDQVLTFAERISTAGILLPVYLNNNPGACLGLTLQAIEWRMSPLAVMQKSYAVNGRVGYESQLIHAIVEARAPLQHRLDCEYDGVYEYIESEREDKKTKEKYTVRHPDLKRSTRRCIVRGLFSNGDLREYETPEIRNIRVKNSTQWWDDPDQQLFYYASRSWARKWCPDVLMGIYSKEELQADPTFGREGDELAPAPGLAQRLLASGRGSAGHQDGHAEAVLDAVENGGQAEAPAGQESAAVPGATPGPAKAGKRTSARPKAKAPPQEADTVPAVSKVAYPSSVAEYLAYARRWLKAEPDKVAIGQRWKEERSLRNSLGMTADDRAPLEELMRKLVK